MCRRTTVLRWFMLVNAMLLWPLATNGVAGQNVDGSIFGNVTDSTSARLPGVTVIATSPALIQGQEVRVTGPEGAYRFASLAPGVYNLTFELGGFQTIKREGITLLSGQSLPVDTQMSLATLEEAITVTGEAPIIDTRNSALVNIQDQAVLENVPTQRSFNELVNIMPGVTDARYGFAPTNIVHGSSPRQNFYAIDGVNFDDAIQSTSAFTIPVDSWQEIQISTAGVNAEYGDSAGAVINYVSKSGGNQFQGSANFFYQDKSMQSNNLPDNLQSTSGAGVDRVYETGVTIGGPILKDRLWFFSNYRYVDNTIRVLDFRGLPQLQENQWFNKGTFQLSDAHRLSGSYYYWDHDNFPWADVASFRNSGDDRTWMGLLKEVHMVNPRWTAVLNENTLFEAVGSAMVYKIIATNPNNAGDHTYMDVATGIVTGGDTHAAGDNRRNRNLVKGDLSHFREALGGSHSFKGGFLYQNTPVYQDSFIQGARGPNELVGCGEQCLSDLPDTIHLLFNQAPYRVRQYNSPVRQNFNMHKWDAYFQDQWVIRDRVTLNLGVRIDHATGILEDSPQGGGFWEPQVTVFPRQDGVIDITNVAPRFGFVWDVTGDHRTTVKGTASRYYHQLGVAYLQPAMPAALGYREFDWTDADGDRVFDSGEQGTLRADTRVDPARLPSIDPDLKNGYTDVFTIGAERQIGADWGLTFTGIFKRDDSIPGLVNTAVPFSAYQPITVTNPLDGQSLGIFTLPRELQAVRPQIILTNPTDPALVREYNGLEIVLNRRLRNDWLLQASYVWGLAEGNISNQYGNSDYGRFTNPNAYINQYGQLSMSPEHQFKTYFSWMAPYGIVFSGYFQALSGLPISNTPNFLVGVQGATTVRIFRRDFPQILSEDFIDVAGEPAGTEKFDAQTALDLRFEKRFPVGLGDIAITGDIFNVFNSGAVIRVGDLRLGSPNYLVPSEVQRPRQLRLGLNWRF